MANYSNLGVDLHTHTLASDGAWSARSLVEAALARNIQVLGVCDHETTANLSAVRLMTRKYGMHFIPGVEVAIEHRGSIYHLLLYGFDPENEKLQALLAQSRQRLWRKKQVMAASLKRRGYKLPETNVNGEKSSTSPLNELAKELCSENPQLSFRQAWDLCRQVEPKMVTAQPARIALAVGKAAGAVAILAHPGRGGSEISVASNVTIKELVKMGLDGVEAYYSEHTPAETERLVKFAGAHNLLVSCGSDSHNAGRKPIPWNSTLCSALLNRLTEKTLALAA